MRKIILLFLFAISFSCVQKTRNVTVEYRLDVSGIKNIKTVGIRGGDKPLNWEKGQVMNPLKKDSLYNLFVTYKTGYNFTEVKFVVNDSIELAEQENRKVIFSPKDTTVYVAKYNVIKK